MKTNKTNTNQPTKQNQEKSHIICSVEINEIKLIKNEPLLKSSDTRKDSYITCLYLKKIGEKKKHLGGRGRGRQISTSRNDLFNNIIEKQPTSPS